jgi:Flp pilus assembly protein TadG
MSAILTRFRRRFFRQTGGAVAVEFAMVALPLIMMLFSILEQGMVYIVSSTLEAATYSSARAIRTGQAQTGNATATSFKNDVCAKLSWLGSQCQSNLLIDVRTYSSFTNPGVTPPLKNGQMDPTQMTWDAGKAGDIVLVRAYYSWPLMLAGWSSGLVRTSDGKAVITATTTFRNEPYGS